MYILYASFCLYFTQGKDVRNIIDTDMPSMLIGSAALGPMDFTGTMFVNGDTGNDYMGIVFGYQSNREFYVVMWKKENENSDTNQAGIKGVQIKVGQELTLISASISLTLKT